jgi:hypothetical protein
VPLLSLLFSLATSALATLSPPIFTHCISSFLTFRIFCLPVYPFHNLLPHPSRALPFPRHSLLLSCLLPFTQRPQFTQPARPKTVPAYSLSLATIEPPHLAFRLLSLPTLHYPASFLPAHPALLSASLLLLTPLSSPPLLPTFLLLQPTRFRYPTSSICSENPAFFFPNSAPHLRHFIDYYYLSIPALAITQFRKHLPAFALV